MSAYDRLVQGLLGGGMDPEQERRLSEEQRRAAMMRGVGDFGAAMLAASGPSPYPVGFGQALGQGLMAGRQGYQQATQEQLARQQEMAQRQAEEQFYASLPEPMQRLARMVGAKEFAKIQHEQQGRIEAARARGTGSGAKVIGPGSALVGPDGKVIYQSEHKPVGFDVIDIPMGDGTTVKGRFDPLSGSVVDMQGNVLSGGVRGGGSRQQQSPADDVIAAIEADAGRKLTASERREVANAVASGGQFNVPAEGGDVGRTRAPEEQIKRNALAEHEAQKTIDAPKAAARLRDAQYSADSVIENVRAAKKLSGGLFATGWGAQLTGWVGGSPAKNLEAKLKTVKSNIGFAELQKMRDNSPTGGALGGIAIQELDMLQSTIDSLDQLQNEEQLAAALDKIEVHLQNWKQIVDEDYQQRYGARRPAQPAQQPGGGFRIIGVR